MGRKKKEQNNFVEGGIQNGFDEVKLEKEYEDILNIQRKQSDHLLGNFSGGKYDITNEDIRQKLLAIPKIYGNTEENVSYASIKLNEFVLNFKIELLIEPTFCEAKLYIIEIEHGVEENIKHTTLLDSIVAPYSFSFREDVFKAWNVLYEGEEYQIDDFLLRYMNMLDDDFMFNREIYSILGQLYVMRMLALLTSLGEDGQKAEYEFKMYMEKLLQENPNAANDFIQQKRILDNIIQKNNLMGKILATENGKKIVEGYVTPIKNIEQRRAPTIIETINPKKKEETQPKKQEEIQQSKPAAKKKKSAEKSSDGGSAKKTEKKKDDKKEEKKKKDDKRKFFAGALKTTDKKPPKAAPKDAALPGKGFTPVATTPPTDATTKAAEEEAARLRAEEDALFAVSNQISSATKGENREVREQDRTALTNGLEQTNEKDSDVKQPEITKVDENHANNEVEKTPGNIETPAALPTNQPEKKMKDPESQLNQEDALSTRKDNIEKERTF